MISPVSCYRSQAIEINRLLLISFTIVFQSFWVALACHVVQPFIFSVFVVRQECGSTVPHARRVLSEAESGQVQPTAVRSGGFNLFLRWLTGCGLLRWLIVVLRPVLFSVSRAQWNLGSVPILCCPSQLSFVDKILKSYGPWPCRQPSASL